MMESYWRPLAPESTEPFARTIDAAKNYVVSTTLDRVDGNAELVSRLEFGSGAVAIWYEPRTWPLGLLARVGLIME